MKRLILIAAALLASASLFAKIPVIGISGYVDGSKNVIGTTYTNAVRNAGGAPVIIPQTADEDVIEAILSNIDGLIMTGGSDYDPLLYYGEEPIRELGDIVPDRDYFDVMLVRAAVKRGIPVLGICRGEQLLAAAFGGSLWQDIPTQIPESYVKHRQGGTPGSYGTHSITIEKGSFLEKALGSRESVVNSFHHQAIKDVPQGFKVVARSADGIIEGVERVAPLKNYPDGSGMIIGTQFHPEALVAGRDKSFRGIFELLVKEAAK
ncbi:MAG: gamma-glutamyl-gamma-aminobutyrate hydrolase family protein [Bacteroidales bacterium]|nr:gamma-glutamyl-gamma-aminobutyrate hydrolase family protein [Bacteroidales bacterium]